MKPASNSGGEEGVDAEEDAEGFAAPAAAEEEEGGGGVPETAADDDRAPSAALIISMAASTWARNSSSEVMIGRRSCEGRSRSMPVILPAAEGCSGKTRL